MTEECTLEFGPDGLARLDGDLTFDTCTRLYHAIQRQLREGKTLDLIYLRAVGSANSAGLAQVLEWQSESSSSGGNITVSGAPDSLVNLAGLAAAEALVKLDVSEEERT